MLCTKAFTLAVLVCFALGVAATSAASAHEFNNKGAESKLVGTAQSTQVFTTAAGKYECTKLEVVSGQAPTGKTASLLVVIQLSGCKFFGLSAKASPLYLLLNANGELSIRKPFTLQITGCEIVFPEQTAKTINFENLTPRAVKLVPDITGITSEGKGEACDYASESQGTLEGASSLSLESGSEFEWK